MVVKGGLRRDERRLDGWSVAPGPEGPWGPWRPMSISTAPNDGRAVDEPGSERGPTVAPPGTDAARWLRRAIVALGLVTALVVLTGIYLTFRYRPAARIDGPGIDARPGLVGVAQALHAVGAYMFVALVCAVVGLALVLANQRHRAPGVILASGFGLFLVSIGFLVTGFQLPWRLPHSGRSGTHAMRPMFLTPAWRHTQVAKSPHHSSQGPNLVQFDPLGCSPWPSWLRAIATIFERTSVPVFDGSGGTASTPRRAAAVRASNMPVTSSLRSRWNRRTPLTVPDWNRPV